MQQIVTAQKADFATVRRLGYSLRGRYPFLQMEVIGKSLCGREIYALTLGNGSGVLLAGAFHGMEWLNALLLLRLTEVLCNGLETDRPVAGIQLSKALQGKKIVIVPMVNPDGVAISLSGLHAAGRFQRDIAHTTDHFSCWQANARGVDINHNFDAGFDKLQVLEREAGIVGPGPTRYGGAYPESEPETRAICDLCREQEFRHALAFHSQGEEIYWNYGRNTPKKARLMAQVLASLSGYTLARPEAIASYGGFKDWFIEFFHRPAFTIETGRGKNPLPETELEPIFARLLEMMVVSAVL